MTNVTKHFQWALLWAAAGFLAWPPSGQTQEGVAHRDAMPGPARRPPPEAFHACEGKSEGAACQVTFHEQTLDGTCVAPRKDELFCMPTDMPDRPNGPPPHGPPPERDPR